MARIRSLKHDFYLDDELAKCSIWSRHLFPGLWLLADRTGRLEDRPLKIKAQIFPYDDLDVDTLLDELQKGDFILRYSVDGRAYIQVRSFLKHQNPHPKEAKSVIPPPENTENLSAKSREITRKEIKSRENNMVLNHGSLSMVPGSDDEDSAPEGLLPCPEEDEAQFAMTEFPKHFPSSKCPTIEEAKSLARRVLKGPDIRGSPSETIQEIFSHLQKLHQAAPLDEPISFLMACLRESGVGGFLRSNPKRRGNAKQQANTQGGQQGLASRAVHYQAKKR